MSPTKAIKDIVFRFIIEYSSLRDFGPLGSWCSQILAIKNMKGKQLNILIFFGYLPIWTMHKKSENFSF